MMQRALLVLALVLASLSAKSEPSDGFAAFLAALWPDAAKEGISARDLRRRFCRAYARRRRIAARRAATGIRQAVRRLSRKPGLARPGRRRVTQIGAMGAHFAGVGEKFGVEPAILVSIWGIESSYGDGEQHWDVFRSLATLAQARFHHPFFRDELLSALKILQDDHIPRREFVGSWAGAMGQAQFMPSSFLRYAVDFDGDGKADIWRSVPDVLASIANYLQKTGLAEGAALGLRGHRTGGLRLPSKPRQTLRMGAARFYPCRRQRRCRTGDAAPVILFFPSGASGPAFLVTDNFVVLKRFNNSDAYALAAGALSDRLRGLPPIRARWPADDVQPSRDERIALQHRLAELGYKIAEFEGHLDFDLRDAVRDQQRRFGMIPDGYPSRAFLSRMGLRAP